MIILEYLRHLKNILVKDQIQYRRIRFGICKGYYLPLNLRCQFRCFVGLYETEILKFIKSYTETGFCCYDIGASAGYYSMAFSNLAAPGQVYAIEANEKLYDLLKETISRNQLQKPKIIASNYFVGNITKVEKKRVTLDYLVFEKKYPPPDLIKMDIEGAEYDVLKGGLKVIREFSPKIIVEVHSEELKRKCKLLLEQEGYEITGVNQNAALPLRPGPYNGWLCGKKERCNG